MNSYKTLTFFQFILFIFEFVSCTLGFEQLVTHEPEYKYLYFFYLRSLLAKFGALLRVS